MRITSNDGVQVKSNDTGYEVWLTLMFICPIIRVSTDRGTKSCVLARYAKTCITIVEAKRENEMMGDNMPEATSQAIALSHLIIYVYIHLGCFVRPLAVHSSQNKDSPVFFIRRTTMDVRPAHPR